MGSSMTNFEATERVAEATRDSGDELARLVV